MIDDSAMFPTMAQEATQVPAPTSLVTSPALPDPGQEPLYPSMPPDDAPQAAPAAPTLATGAQPPAETPQVQVIIPTDVRALREADTDRVMFSAQKMYESAIPDDLFDPDSVESELSPEAQAAVIGEYREMAADCGLSNTEVSQLQARILAQRANPVPNAVQQAEAVRRLESAFGANGAEQALAAANRLLDRDPRIKEMIKAWGVGNDPDTIVMVAQVARREQARGRLK